MSNLFDWLYTDTSKTQTPEEAQANYSRLQKQLIAQGKPLGANAGTLEDPGSAAATTFYLAATGQKDPNDPNPTPGIWNVLKDVFILVAVGLVIWGFIKFGGVGLLKTLTKKSKWYVLGIAGAVALLAWWIYSQFKKTGSDAASTAQGISDSIKQLNPFA